MLLLVFLFRFLLLLSWQGLVDSNPGQSWALQGKDAGRSGKERKKREERNESNHSIRIFPFFVSHNSKYTSLLPPSGLGTTWVFILVPIIPTFNSLSSHCVLCLAPFSSSLCATDRHSSSIRIQFSLCDCSSSYPATSNISQVVAVSLLLCLPSLSYSVTASLASSTKSFLVSSPLLQKMAPKTFTAPKVWKRPYTSIYNDNYRFGNSLYSSAVADIENRSKGYAPYFAAPPTGSVISDPGVRRAILEAELLTSSDILPTDLIESALTSKVGSKASESTLGTSSAAIHGSSALTKADLSASSSYSRSILEQTTTTTTTTTTPIGGRRASDSLNFSAYSSAKELANLESELEESRARRRRHVTNRPTTIYVSGGVGSGRSSSPIFSHHDVHLNTSDLSATSLDAGSTANKDWSLERCCELQREINRLSQQLTESEHKMKQETDLIKKQLTQDVADLVIVLDDQDRTVSELSRCIKQQHRQIEELQREYDLASHKYEGAVETLTNLQNKAKSLCREVDQIRAQK